MWRTPRRRIFRRPTRCPGSPVAGKAYFISQGEPVNCWGWINDILALNGLPPVKKAISLATAWRVGAAFELLYKLFRISGDPPMTRFLATQIRASHYYDIGRAQRDFGYNPNISTCEGMRRHESLDRETIDLNKFHLERGKS